jgi:DNA-binding XRE family transcriptional regulator
MATTIKAHAPSSTQAYASGPALYSWRRSVGLNRETFAKLTKVSERTLATYEKHERLPAPIRPQVTEAVRLVKALLELIPAGELAKWLATPNAGFGGKRPWTLIERGEGDRVWEMIHQARQGAFA